VKTRTKTTWILGWAAVLVGVTVGVAWQSSVSAPEAQSTPVGQESPSVEKDGVRMTLLPEWSQTPPDARTALYALELEAANVPTKRRPVSLAVVLDTSGSMHGNKIKNGRAALVRVLEHLAPGDQLSVVTFDTAAELAVDGHEVGSPDHDYVAAVQRIDVGGGTCIDCGLRLARTVLDDAPAPNQRRLLLISDGKPTVGKANPDVLRAQVKELLGADVVTSVLGVGRAVNGDLLANMANEGSGIYQFVRNSSALDTALAREAADLGAAVASGVTVDLTTASGASVDGPAQLVVAQLRPGTPRRFLVRVSLPEGAWSGDLLTATARWNSESGAASLSMRSPVQRGLAGVRSWAVTVEDARAQNSAAMTQALGDAEQGRRGEAEGALGARLEALPVLLASAPDWVRKDMGAEQREIIRIRDIVRVEAPSSPAVRGNFLYQQFRFNNIDNGNPSQVTPAVLENLEMELE
jgi:uncharacterized protein YegL